jgi:hypothetical protein
VLVSSVNSLTGAVTLTKANVGLGNVDNTSDVNKPVSTAQQNALNLKANTANPTFTGASSNALGTVGAPSITFTGDTNTGMFSPAADVVALSAAGQEKLRVAANPPAVTVADNLIVQGANNTFPAASINSDALGPLLFNTQSGNYTLALSDASRVVIANGAAAQTITIPTNAAVALPVGAVVEILSNNGVPGAVAITASAGVSFFFNTGSVDGNASGGATVKLRDNVTSARLLKLGVNSWFAFGDIIP